MGVMVAVASSDDISVNEHFGRAKRFIIYEFEAGEWKRIDSRDNQPACAGHEHNDDLLERTAELIADCRAVVISQIGSTATDLLLGRRILPFMLSGPIDEVLKTVEGSKRFISLH